MRVQQSTFRAWPDAHPKALPTFEEALELLTARQWPLQHIGDRKVRTVCPIHLGGCLDIRQGSNSDAALIWCFVCDESGAEGRQRTDWIRSVFDGLKNDDVPIGHVFHNSSGGGSGANPGGAPWGPALAQYLYQDEEGNDQYRKDKHILGQKGDGTPDKAFRWYRHIDTGSLDGTWVLGKNGYSAGLYRLPELIASDIEATVYVVEGEKDVDGLMEHGLVATTAGGANDWEPQYARFFEGRHVVLIPDRDKPGQKAAAKIEADLSATVKLLERIDLPYEILPKHGKDLSDWFGEGNEELPEAHAVTETVADAATAHIRDRSAYFCGGQSGSAFVPPMLAQDIRDELKITRGPGGGLWRDVDGVYRPGAEDHVANLVRQTLGPLYRANHLNEIMSWMRALPVEIMTDPPPGNLINLRGGVLELDSLTLRSVSEEERFTYQVPIRWNANARCPGIEGFLEEVVPADCVELVYEIIGMCLLPTSRYRRAVMLLGPGSNGKSVLLGVIRSLLGRENVAAVTLQALSEERFAKASLFGKLANIAGDLDSKPVERSGAFKTLTGEDPVEAERKYCDPFTFINYATLLFSANEWPVSHDQTDAYFTRWIAIPLHQRYREDGGGLKPGERRADPRLLDRLTTDAELEGLLVKAVAGAKALQERGGFAVPQSVRDSVAEYRQWADTVMAWIDECVRSAVDPSLRMQRRDIYRLYQEWCRTNGRKSVSSKKFWPRFREVLADQGIEFDEVKNAGERMVEGMAITP